MEDPRGQVYQTSMINELVGGFRSFVMPKLSPRSEPTSGATAGNWFAQLAHSRRCQLAGAALLVVLTCVVYWPAMRGDFILDDDVLLTLSPVIRAPNGLHRIWFTTEPVDYWPVTNTTLWLEWRLWGMNSIGYHLTNLALHLADALLVWCVLRKVAVPGAFLAALLFALHPVNVESVAWIAQRKNLLALLFFLISILCYLKFGLERPQTTNHDKPRFSISWYFLSLLSFALAMLSKGSVAILPLVLLLLIWWKQGRIPWSDFTRVAPFFILAALLALMNVWFQTHGNGSMVLRQASFLERLLGAGAVVWFYLAKAIVPVHLVFVYPLWKISTADVWWWLPLLAAVAVTVALWFRRNTRIGRPLLLAWAFFCIALLPVLGFTDVGFMQYSLVADHYQHVALIGVVALAAAGWNWWRERSIGRWKFAATFTAIVVIGVFAVLTWQQTNLYATPTRLYEATLQDNPDCFLVYNLLGRINAEAGQSDRAIGLYEHSLQINPDYADAHYNLARELADKAVRLNDKSYLPMALAHYETAIRIGKNTAETISNYAVTLEMAGRTRDSLRQLEAGIRRYPNDLSMNYNLANALGKQQRWAEALVVAQHAMSLAKADGNDYMMNLIEGQLRALHSLMSQPAGDSSPPQPSAPRR